MGSYIWKVSTNFSLIEFSASEMWRGRQACMLSRWPGTVRCTMLLMATCRALGQRERFCSQILLFPAFVHLHHGEISNCVSGGSALRIASISGTRSYATRHVLRSLYPETHLKRPQLSHVCCWQQLSQSFATVNVNHCMNSFCINAKKASVGNPTFYDPFRRHPHQCSRSSSIPTPL